jgi:putative membrane protein
MVVVIGLMVTGVVLLVQQFASGSRHSRSADELLAQRFARGEIDETEYRGRRDALRG